jgi:hypothetical protein
VTGKSLLGLLRDNPDGITTKELCRAFDVRPVQIRMAVCRLRQEGYVIANLTGGGHYPAHYRLVSDPGDPRHCTHPGCTTILARGNRGPCCWQHARWPAGVAS